MCVATPDGYHNSKETCNPVTMTHVGNIPRNTVQPNANEYTKELPSFIERTKQQKYCNSIRGAYDPETKTDQVQLKEYCNKEDILFTMF
jgi:hypothetical protein